MKSYLYTIDNGHGEQLTFLMTRYRSEYAMLELPPFVRRVVIPMLFVVGRVLGKHEKYRDAPTPMSER